MDDRSTPLSSLNNQDDSEVVSQILEKYNNLQDTQKNDHEMMASQLMPRPLSGNELMDLPPLQPNQQVMENQFENRDLNSELYKMNGQDPIIMSEYNKQMQQTNSFLNQQTGPVEDDEEYVEYEEVNDEEPMWRKILNEVRIPLFMIIFIFIFFSSEIGFDKLICVYPFFGDSTHYDCNWKGTLLKSFIVGILAYLSIRFIRV